MKVLEKKANKNTEKIEIASVEIIIRVDRVANLKSYKKI